MSTPIIEQIAVLMKAAIEKVSIANGDNVTVSEVRRPVLMGIPADVKHWGVVMQQLDEDQDSAGGVSGNPPGVDKIQEFSLDLVLRITEDDTTPFDTLANLFDADVTKAVMADVQWEELASDTVMLPSVFIRDEDGTFSGKTLFVAVHYSIAENNPYSKP